MLMAAHGGPTQSANPADWTIYITNDNCPDYTWGLTEEQTRQAFADVVKGQLDEMKSRFVLTVTHELRSPVGVIRSLLRTLTAGYTATIDAHELQFNLRHDDYSDVGGATTGLLGYGYRLTPAVRLSATVSSAFRAPTFNELYGPYGSNPALDPESARSAELGLTYTGAYGLVRATVFATRTHDLINFVPPTWNATNVDEAKNLGVEISWSGKLAGLDARSAVTFQNPEDKATGLGLLRRADRFGSVSLGQAQGAFDWRMEVLASGPHPDVHATTYSRISVPGYAVLNLNIGWKPARDWKLSGKLLNLLDKDYTLVHGYNTQDRGAFIELAYTP